MLIRFEVGGFKAFKDPLILDLKARDYSFNPSLVRQGVVKNALVYGPNGIGKSCLGFALFDLIEHLTDKKQFRQEYLAEYQNISLGPEDPICFRYDFIFNGTVLVYKYRKNELRELLFEQLEINGELCFKWDYFDASKCDTPALRKIGVQLDLPDNKLSILKYVRRNVLTGTIPAIDQLMSFVDGMLWYRSLSEGNAYAGFTNGKATLDVAICTAGKVEEFSKFLKDNGLVYSLSSGKIGNEDHLFVEDPGNHRKVPFLNIASTGTVTLMLFFYWAMVAFEKVSFLFIDEFDAFFHFQSAAAIIKRLNVSKFQVMLTSHNTYLMQNAFTRPDCCFLMFPGKIRNLPDCTDREIREAHNLEKMYQHGVFSE